MTRHYVIVGAGLVGLFAAFVLLEEGHAVTLHTPTPPGRPGPGVASWAGGGILSPLRPWTAPEAVARLVFPAVTQLPALLARLEVCTGLPGGWRGGGMRVFPGMDIATEVSEPDPVVWGCRHGVTVQACHEAHRGDGLWLPGIGSVHNPSLWRLMAAAVERLGGRFRLGAVPPVGDAGPAAWAAGLASAAGGAEAVIVCAGAWSGGLCGLSDEVFPVRGQMARVELGQPLSEIVQVGAHYLVPRSGRGAVVGSTLEPEAGFAAVPTAGGRRVLEDWLGAQAQWLGPAQVTDHWAGLRPGSPSGVPLIGPVGGTDGRLWLAAGHHRNGICSAPGTARLLADLLAGRRPACDPAPYDPVARGVGQARTA